MALNLFLGEIPIPVTTWTTKVAALAARDITGGTAGSFYTRAVAADESLVGHVDAAITADWVGGVVVAFNDTTGRVGITNTDGALNLTLELSAPLAVAMGYSAPAPTAPAAANTIILPGSTWTSTYQAQYVWLPNVEPSGLAAYVGSPGKPIHDAKVAISNSGAYKRTIGPTRYECPMTFKGLTARKAWQSSEVVLNESLESFWDDCMNYGRIVRWFDDRSDAAYTQAFRLKSETLELKEAQANYQSVWTVDLVFTQSVES